MLSNLNVKNIALINSLEVDFSDGLNVLSGETGAGKSIIIDSLSFVMGKRADKSLIRYGEESASVTAVFEKLGENTLRMLKEYDIECDDDQLIIKRTMTQEGKNTCSVNNQRVTLAVLKDIASTLADIYGQHENVSVLNSSNHLNIIDKYGEKQLSALLEKQREIYTQYKDVCSKLAKYGSLKDVNKNIDLLEYQINEIENADVKEGEEDELIALRHKLNNSQTIVSALNECHNILDGDDGENVISLINHCMSQLTKVASFDPQIEEIVERLDSSKTELKDIACTVSDIAENSEFNMREYEECEQRIALIRSIKRKYGNTVQEIQAFLEDIKEQYEFLSEGEEKVVEYEKEKESLLSKLYKNTLDLSKERQKVAKSLSDSVLKELKELGMPSCKFKADFAPLAEIAYFTPSASGSDDVTFMFSANAGQPEKELSKVISGGELSRFMLAMKKIIANLDGISTMVFDEIDTGISGKIAQIVAEKMADISRDKQVLAITHMPQLASMADIHYLIEKYTQNGKTLTRLVALQSESRQEEIARLIGGKDYSTYAMPHAKEMIEYSDNYKKAVMTS